MIYRFGNFTLDPATRTLMRYGEPVPLPPKSFECIVYLMENHDRAVGRDELISAVWGRIDASDAVVAQTLLRARRAINDTGDRQSRIRTVPRFGYQWVGTFEKTEQKGRPESPGPIPTDQPRTGGRRWPLALLFFAGLSALVAVAILQGERQGTGDAAPEEEQAGEPGLTAVLPVVVAPESAETAWIRLGAMDYVASRLREQPGMLVLPSSRTLGLVSDLAAGDDAIGRVRDTTGAQNVLAPTAIFDDGRWRFRLLLDRGEDQQLVEVESETPLGAAAAATDMMLRRLGINGTALPVPTELTERLQQVDAELLAGQLATARGLIATAPNEQAGHPQLKVRQGQLEFRAGQLEIARSIFTTLLDSDPLPDDDVRARALMGLGAVALRSREFEAAEHRYAQALELLVQSGLDARDPALAGNAYNGRGVSRVELGRVDDGIADLGRARIAMARAGDEVEAATVGTNIGLLELRRGHPARAIQEFDKAAGTFERFGVRDNLAAVLLSTSRAELQLVRPEKALRDATRALAMGEALENPRLQQSINAAYVESLLTNGRLSQAQDHLAQMDPANPALELALQLGSGRFADAAALARSMLDEDTPASNHAVLLAIQASLLNSDTDLAARWRERLASDDTEHPVNFSQALADALMLTGESATPGDADAAFDAALQAATGHLTPADEVRAGAAYVLHLVAEGRLDRASEVLGSFSLYAESDYRAARAALALYQALGDDALAAGARQQVNTLAGERDPTGPVIF